MKTYKTSYIVEYFDNFSKLWRVLEFYTEEQAVLVANCLLNASPLEEISDVRLSRGIATCQK